MNDKSMREILGAVIQELSPILPPGLIDKIHKLISNVVYEIQEMTREQCMTIKVPPPPNKVVDLTTERESHGYEMGVQACRDAIRNLKIIS